MPPHCKDLRIVGFSHGFPVLAPFALRRIFIPIDAVRGSLLLLSNRFELAQYC